MDGQPNMTLDQYIKKQREFIKLEYDLEKIEKQKIKLKNIELFFILRSKAPPGSLRKWTTTLPLPKNLIPPEYLIQTDPTYVNISDKIIIKFDEQKDPIEGTVEKIRDGELTAVFILDWEEESARYTCSINFAPSDIVYKRKKHALKNLPELNPDLQNMLCRIYPQKQNIPKIYLDLPRNYHFNKSQIRAIQMAISNPFSLIQGPPGTGKTHTIGAIAIQELKRDPTKKVLVCGTTNVSINSLLEIVGDMVQEEGFEVCWPAASSRDFVAEEDLTKEQKLTTLYKSCHLDLPASKRFKELRGKYELEEEEIEEMESLRKTLEQKIIKDSNIIFSTLDSSGKKTIIDNIGKISTLIVDEATLSVESSVNIPLSLLPDRFVLVGDHKQLGPSKKFDELKVQNYYYSMFQRIINEKSCKRNSTLLSTQYRMHPEISLLPNRLFYQYNLLDGVRPEDREIAKNFKLQTHFNFFNTKGEEVQNGTSYTNEDEKNLVSDFVNSLVDSGVSPSQIGVISAYGAQAKLISEHFRFFGPRVKVSTIDSFQGSQKDYVIICTTRKGEDIGFLKDRRRMNVAITRARCMVAIFGNEETLSKSEFWKAVIDYSKMKNSFYERLPIKIEKKTAKALIITRPGENAAKELSEFKENEVEAGYNLREIKSEISSDKVRVLWPDEEEDVKFLKQWVDKRVKILNDGYNVTLSYDAEGVCMQFGDIFDYNVDYYNWKSSENEIPKIRTNESIIISFYKHRGKYDVKMNDEKHDDINKSPVLVEIMKPLLEHPKITIITFDFTFDFDKLYDFGINLKTKRIIDSQLMILPEQSELNEREDLICSTGWKSISEYVKNAIEDSQNENIIQLAKESVKKGNKNFPHSENNFLISQFNYPQLCKFTKLFLEYSASDIFYTAVVGVNVLSKGKLDFVKEQSLNKFNKYLEYREKYKCVLNLRQSYYIRGSLTTAIQAEFSEGSQTIGLLSIHRKLDSFVNLLDNCPELLIKIIPSFSEKDKTTIKERYEKIIEIMKNPKYIHIKNIKNKAQLAYVKEDKLNEESGVIFKNPSKYSAWNNLNIEQITKTKEKNLENNETKPTNEENMSKIQQKNANKVVSAPFNPIPSTVSGQQQNYSTNSSAPFNPNPIPSTVKGQQQNYSTNSSLPFNPNPIPSTVNSQQQNYSKISSEPFNPSSNTIYDQQQNTSNDSFKSPNPSNKQSIPKLQRTNVKERNFVPQKPSQNQNHYKSSSSSTKPKLSILNAKKILHQESPEKTSDPANSVLAHNRKSTIWRKITKGYEKAEEKKLFNPKPITENNDHSQEQ